MLNKIGVTCEKIVKKKEEDFFKCCMILPLRITLKAYY